MYVYVCLCVTLPYAMAIACYDVKITQTTRAHHTQLSEVILETERALPVSGGLVLNGVGSVENLSRWLTSHYAHHSTGH